MSFNVVDLVTDQLKGPLLNQMTNLLGDDGANASKGLESAVPALLSGLTGVAQTPEGAGNLFNAVQQQDDSILSNLGSLLGGNDSGSLISSGGSMLGSLLGNSAMGSLGGILSKFTGMSSGGTSSLMGMLAPVIIGILKKKVLGDGLNAGGLASMLLGQKSNIMSAMPSGLGDQLSGISGFADIGGQLGDAASGLKNAAESGVASASQTVSNAASGVGDAAHDAVDTAKSTGGGLKKFLIPLIAIALLAWLAMKFLGDNGADTAVDQAADAVSGAVGDVDVSELGTNLTGIFNSASETLGGVTDLDSAKAAVPGLEELGGKVTGAAELFNKVPEAARGPLSGIASEGLGSLQPIIDKVMAIPGVGDVLKPIIDPILEALSGMAG
ncbi:MAG: DUF937 domain-containing protein [Gammaproteobacteria bacterium]|nr:DUF937 domain-containing protein [Gammaproteobacteria bacterium]